VVKPAGKKQMVSHMKDKFSLSERKSCYLAGLSRTGYRYQAKPKGDELVRSRLKELATKLPRNGYLMLHGFLKQEGLVINKKRTYRIYTEEGLQVRTKKRKKLSRPRMPMITPMSKDVRWSMDFVSDQLVNGRRIRILNVIDDYSRELVGQMVDFSISGSQVARFLNELGNARSLPDQIVCDNGPEFTCKAMYFWQQENKVKLAFIQPGKPTQNAFVESFNGKFRNECLNQHWFRDIDEARAIINKWQVHYNYQRPHSSLGYKTPVAFAKKAA
jgi:putative transposase